MDDAPQRRGRFALFAGLLVLAMLGLAAAVAGVWRLSSQRMVLQAPDGGEMIAEETARATAWVRLKEDAGKLAAIELRPRGSATFQSVASPCHDLDVALTALQSHLKKLRPSDGGRETLVVIEADGGLKQRHLVRVYDACKAAGYGQITFTQAAARSQGLH